MGVQDRGLLLLMVVMMVMVTVMEHYTEWWPHPSSAWQWLGESRERRQQRSSRRWRGRGRLPPAQNCVPCCGSVRETPHYQQHPSCAGQHHHNNNNNTTTLVALRFLTHLPLREKSGWSSETRHGRQQQHLDLIGMKPSPKVESQYSQGSVKGGKYSNV